MRIPKRYSVRDGVAAVEFAVTLPLLFLLLLGTWELGGDWGTTDAQAGIGSVPRVPHAPVSDRGAGRVREAPLRSDARLEVVTPPSG